MPKTKKRREMYRISLAIYERAEAEAQRRRGMGEDIRWTEVIREILEAHLPESQKST